MKSFDKIFELPLLCRDRNSRSKFVVKTALNLVKVHIGAIVSPKLTVLCLTRTTSFFKNKFRPQLVSLVLSVSIKGKDQIPFTVTGPFFSTVNLMVSPTSIDKFVLLYTESPRLDRDRL